MSRMNFHDEVTPAQARVLFHMERLFRDLRRTEAHHKIVGVVRAAGYDVERVLTWTTADCRTALRLIEQHARELPEMLFRDTSTGWEDFA